VHISQKYQSTFAELTREVLQRNVEKDHRLTSNIEAHLDEIPEGTTNEHLQQHKPSKIYIYM